MTKAETSGYYKVTVPAGTWKAVIFCRMSGSASANNWNNKWNQTGDLLASSANGKNCFTLASGNWDGATTTWSNFCDGHHTWNAGSQTKAPTCSVEGTMKYTCTKCSSTKTEAIPTIDHTFNGGESCEACGASNPDYCAHSNKTEFNTAKCTEAGVHYYECDKCHDIFDETPVDALGHNYVNGVCSRCNMRIVYFVNGAEWTTVNAYAWIDNGAGLTWPGKAMTKSDLTVNNYDVYYIELDTAYTKIIFKGFMKVFFIFDKIHSICYNIL
jgi:DNA-directed RNA polymerase subunit RPC12/RpoP